jgi:hypothetical protein
MNSTNYYKDFPGGFRSNYGVFTLLGAIGRFWCASRNSAMFNYNTTLELYSCIIENKMESKNIGMALRCIKD